MLILVAAEQVEHFVGHRFAVIRPAHRTGDDLARRPRHPLQQRQRLRKILHRLHRESGTDQHRRHRATARGGRFSKQDSSQGVALGSGGQPRLNPSQTGFHAMRACLESANSTSVQGIVNTGESLTGVRRRSRSLSDSGQANTSLVVVDSDSE
jgi:hypothetical protein